MAAEPELSTDLELDSDVYAQSGTLHARLMIRNEGTEPVTLAFPSGQLYDLELHDGEGNVVYRWSQGRTFSQAAASLQIQFEKDYPISVPLAQLKPGRYVAQAWLTVDGPPRAYSGSARFEIK